MAARRQVCGTPPGAVASTTSFAASAKKKTIPNGRAEREDKGVFEGEKKKEAAIAHAPYWTTGRQARDLRATRTPTPPARARPLGSVINGRSLPVAGRCLRLGAGAGLTVPLVPTATSLTRSAVVAGVDCGASLRDAVVASAVVVDCGVGAAGATYSLVVVV